MTIKNRIRQMLAMIQAIPMIFSMRNTVMSQRKNGGIYATIYDVSSFMTFPVYDDKDGMVGIKVSPENSFISYSSKGEIQHCREFLHHGKFRLSDVMQIGKVVSEFCNGDFSSEGNLEV